MSASRREHGAALIAALFVVILVGSLGAAAMRRGYTLALDDQLERGRLAAQCAAEGGVAHARWALARDPGFRNARIRIGAADVAVAVAGEGERRSVTVTAATRPFGTNGLVVRVRVDAALRLVDGTARVVGWSER